jgi:putative heme iron utilization protein
VLLQISLFGLFGVGGVQVGEQLLVTVTESLQPANSTINFTDSPAGTPVTEFVANVPFPTLVTVVPADVVKAISNVVPAWLQVVEVTEIVGLGLTVTVTFTPLLLQVGEVLLTQAT